MSRKLLVLGTGCARCERLLAVTREAAGELRLDCEVEKVTDVLRFADFGVMVTPALVVDGRIAVAGRVPDLAEMRRLLSSGG